MANINLTGGVTFSNGALGGCPVQAWEWVLPAAVAGDIVYTPSLKNPPGATQVSLLKQAPDASAHTTSLQGSNDGTNWYYLPQLNVASGISQQSGAQISTAQNARTGFLFTRGVLTVVATAATGTRLAMLLSED